MGVWTEYVQMLALWMVPHITSTIRSFILTDLNLTFLVNNLSRIEKSELKF
jgi:hypothetical protein